MRGEAAQMGHEVARHGRVDSELQQAMADRQFLEKKLERVKEQMARVRTEKERVWFCQKGIKGRGPGGRAPPCDDTRDYDKGGNCVWYAHSYLLVRT